MLTVPAAAAQLGISRASFYRLIHRRLLGYIQLPTGALRVEQAELDRFVERCRRRAVVLPTRPARATRQQVRAATDVLAFRAKGEALAALGRSK